LLLGIVRATFGGMNALRVIFAILLFTACGASQSAYKRASSGIADIQPILTTAVFVLAAEKGPKVENALNSVGALLTAWNAANEGQFNLLVPCAAQALREAGSALPEDKAKTLRAVAKVLTSISPGAVCGDDNDGGV